MRIPQIVLVLVAMLCGAPADGQPVKHPSNTPADVTLPPKARLHIYLLMGQSNMVGRDTRSLDVQVSNPQVLALDAAGEWAVAREPIHPQVGRIPGGAGPGLPFAIAMLQADTNVTIGLVPCAVGGTPLRRWTKGGDLYENAVSRAKLAAQTGVLKGVLWHQGEADTANQKNAETYEARLAKMFADLRADLGQPDLPIVVGQLGEFLKLTPEKNPFSEAVCAALKNLPNIVPHVGYADSTGLEHKGDKLHFSAQAQRELGARYAKAMQELQRTPPPASIQSASVVDLWPEGKMPGRGAGAPETNRSPERTDARRITNVSRPTLTIFPAAKTNSPAMIVCPGGGYGYVVVDKEGSDIAAWLNSNNITALVLKYRVPNNRDGALQDVQRALSLARANAAEWNLDPQRLGVIGFSAGGNLAAKASSRYGERAYAPVDAADEQSCRPDFAALVYPAYLERDGQIASDLNLKAQIPPTLIVHNEDDQKFILGSKLYHAALDEAKVPNEFLLYATGGHGYGLRCQRDARVWPQGALDWLSKLNLR